MSNVVPADYRWPADLPADVATLLAGVDRGSMDAVVDAAFAAVEYPPGGLLPAARLTPAQRALVQALVELRIWSPRCRGRLPDRTDLRAWLGLEPSDPFQELVTFELRGARHEEPLWRAIWLLQADDAGGTPEHLAALVGALPLARRYDLWGRCQLRFPPPWGLRGDVFFPIDPHPDRCIELVDGREHAWAARFLDELLAGVPGVSTKRFSTLLPFLELVRAKVPIEPRWHALLPTSGRYDLVDEVLFAIPVEHRAEALQRWLERMMFPANVVRQVTRLLPRVPDPAMLARALDAVPEAMGSARLHLRALREAAGTHAELLALLDAVDAADGPPMILTLLATRKPTRVAELSPEDQAQLLIAGKRYHGKATSLDDLLDVEDEDTGLFDLTVLTIGDAKGTHVYDGWLYMGDSGCFFARGKPRVVAERVQRSIECKDRKLGDALETLLRAPLAPPPASRAKKDAAKKDAAKKAPAKKPPAKKATDKKATDKAASKKPPTRKPPAKKAARAAARRTKPTR